MRNNLTIPKSSTSHTRRIQDYNVCYIKDNKKLVPAMPSHDLLSPNRGKRHIKLNTFENCVSTNIVIKSPTMNKKCYQPIKCKSVLYENWFVQYMYKNTTETYNSEWFAYFKGGNHDGNSNLRKDLSLR